MVRVLGYLMVNLISCKVIFQIGKEIIMISFCDLSLRFLVGGLGKKMGKNIGIEPVGNKLMAIFSECFSK